jgi:hypothetical protein
LSANQDQTPTKKLEKLENWTKNLKQKKTIHQGRPQEFLVSQRSEIVILQIVNNILLFLCMPCIIFQSGRNCETDIRMSTPNLMPFCLI